MAIDGYTPSAAPWVSGGPMASKTTKGPQMVGLKSFSIGTAFASTSPLTDANSREDLLTRAEAAALVGVADRTLDRWHERREGPPRIKIGRQVRYRRLAILRWLADHETVGPRVG